MRNWDDQLVRPGSKDKAHKILIRGRELRELKRFTWAMSEAYELDLRIQAYEGKHSLLLYSWELEFLEDLTAEALEDREAYPKKSGVRYEAMQKLHGRIKGLRTQA